MTKAIKTHKELNGQWWAEATIGNAPYFGKGDSQRDALLSLHYRILVVTDRLKDLDAQVLDLADKADRGEAS